jgi:hypothetical protein
MAEKLGVECPCGFSIATPHGMDDAVAMVQLHLQRIHPEMNRSRAEVVKAIKKM